MTSDAKQIERHHTPGGAAVLGVVAVLSLIAVGIARHPASIRGAGRGPFLDFALVISPVLLMLALFGAAGSAAWERTRSVTLAVIAGVCDEGGSVRLAKNPYIIVRGYWRPDST